MKYHILKLPTRHFSAPLKPSSKIKCIQNTLVQWKHQFNTQYMQAALVCWHPDCCCKSTGEAVPAHIMEIHTRNQMYDTTYSSPKH